MTIFRLFTSLGIYTALHATAPAANQHNDFEDAPFNYHTAEKRDPFTLLQQDVKAGRKKLRGGTPVVFLKDLLENLHVPSASQTLVFSKTAFQRKVVHSDNLRAVYFSDDVYVTYIPGGRIEVASTDPVLGSVFSIFDPTGGPGLPKIESPGACLGCHAGSFTNFLPGPMLRTVVSDEGGRVIFDYPENPRGHGVDFKERWGSWIVQGAPPDMKHLGNLVAEQRDGKWEPRPEKFATAQPVTDFCQQQDLPAAGSDVVALLILDHQVAAHNRIIDAGYRWRHAVDKLNEQRTKNGKSASAELDKAGQDEAREWTRKLQHHLTFGDEVRLPAAVDLSKSAFAAAFQNKGKVREGEPAASRSLRDLKADGTLFRYRLSYLVHGLSFRGYPVEYQQFFWQELKSAFLAEETPPEFQHLTKQERHEILAVVRETVSGLPEGF